MPCGHQKDILFGTAERTGVQMTLVANQPVRVPPSPGITSLQVASGFDVAYNEIVKRLDAGDLVITSDIPYGQKNSCGLSMVVFQ